MLRIDKITDVIAADDWRYPTSTGTTAIARIQIGRPQPVPEDPNGDWYCPVFVEHFTDRVVPAYGVGPVDTLMNAATLVRGFADQMGEFTPRASEHIDETTA